MAATLKQLKRDIGLREGSSSDFAERLFRKADAGLLAQLEPEGLFKLSELAYTFFELGNRCPQSARSKS